MKSRDRTKKKNKLSLRERLLRRKTHRLAAHVSREDQWDYDVPNIKLSRAFVVVVVLHIVAVGGILIFEVLKPEGTGTVPMSQDVDDLATNGSPALTEAIPEGVKIGDPRTAGLQAYIVRAGDTVHSIAAKFGVTTEAIERQNELDRGGRIYPGRNLFIPGREQTEDAAVGLASTLAAGDGGAGTSAAANGASAAVPIPAGEPAAQPQIAAPSPAVVSPPVATPAVREEPAPESRSEPVAPRIALTDSTAPAPEQPLRPVSGTDGGVYVMARGDTAYSIARRYGVKVEQLLRENSISDPTNLQIGQKLKIPSRR